VLAADDGLARFQMAALWEVRVSRRPFGRGRAVGVVPVLMGPDTSTKALV
jgi:hypothetical protein